jgi:hypothetical protein
MGRQIYTHFKGRVSTNCFLNLDNQVQKKSLRGNPFWRLFIPLFFLLASFSCKKSPTIPNAQELNRPVIWLDTTELSFTAFALGGNPSSQVLSVKNVGKNNLQYAISDDADWLSVEPPNGSSTGQMVQHTIFVNKTGLGARDAPYGATISIVSPEAFNNPQRVSVSLKVTAQPPPEIWVSPPAMTFVAKVGTNPSAQTLRVRNSGEGTLTYDLVSDASWLTVSPGGGTSSGGERTHAVSADSSRLAQGNYDAIITISAPDAANSPQLVLVSLRVGTAPPPSTDNRVAVSCRPTSGGSGTNVTVTISIVGNLQPVETFGLELTYDTNLFDYLNTRKGGLTSGWAFVDGNASGGVVTIGGLAGSGAAIPIGSTGSIAVLSLRVTGTGYSNGQQSQLTIRNLSDDISGMQAQPATVTFTFQQ